MRTIKHKLQSWSFHPFCNILPVFSSLFFCGSIVSLNITFCCSHDFISPQGTMISSRLISSTLILIRLCCIWLPALEFVMESGKKKHPGWSDLGLLKPDNSMRVRLNHFTLWRRPTDEGKIDWWTSFCLYDNQTVVVLGRVSAVLAYF